MSEYHGGGQCVPLWGLQSQTCWPHWPQSGPSVCDVTGAWARSPFGRPEKLLELAGKRLMAWMVGPENLGPARSELEEVTEKEVMG